MNETEDILGTAHEWLSKGEKICIATVVKKEGSAPREVGAKMVISSTGKFEGSIGGGAVEKEILEAAPGVIRSGRPLMLDFDLSGESRDLDALCGGKTSIFLEPLGRTRHLFIIGAGHVGMALAGSAIRVGFSVTLVDDREEFLAGDALGGTAGGPPGTGLSGAATVVATPDQAGERLDIDESSFVVICTRGHSLDTEWLGQVIGRSPRYIGMLGSKPKASRVFEELAKRGVPRDALDRVRTPVGLDIGAMTPEEIAVSISAELIREWRKGGEG
jgi:xanthine dehydrogenase accessory factor